MNVDEAFRKPRIVTERDLMTKLLPYIINYPWALDTIGDLWRMGAPTPDSGPGVEEKRILMPYQFASWWTDVVNKMGYDWKLKDVLG